MQQVWEWLNRSHLRAVWVPVAVVALLALVGLGLADLVTEDEGDDRFAGLDTNSQPAEYLYLDNARVLAYLSQFEGGAFQSELRTFSETDQLTASAKAPGESFAVGASAQRQRSIERQVVANATGNYFRLLEHLVQGDPEETHFEPDLSLRSEADFNDIDGGDFVELHTIELQRPEYMAPYLTARQSGTLEALFPDDREARQEARTFARRVGPNPRFTFAIGNSRGLRYLLPVEYESLSDERSLFSSQNRLTIVGKVIRRFTPEIAKERGVPSYVDEATRETWTAPVEEVPDTLLAKALPACPEEEDDRACLARKLRRQTQVRKAGAVIIPVAIYK